MLCSPYNDTVHTKGKRDINSLPENLLYRIQNKGTAYFLFGFMTASSIELQKGESVMGFELIVHSGAGFRTKRSAK